MRIIGLDFGSRTVGVAVCDPLMITAQGVEIIRRKEEINFDRHMQESKNFVLNIMRSVLFSDFLRI